MMHLAAFAFGLAALIAVATSTWVRRDVPLGRWFWTLTFFLVAVPLVPLLAFLLLAAPDPYGYSAIGMVGFMVVFVPIAAGWLLGVLISVIVRFVRAKVRK